MKNKKIKARETSRTDAKDKNKQGNRKIKRRTDTRKKKRKSRTDAKRKTKHDNIRIKRRKGREKKREKEK